MSVIKIKTQAHKEDKDVVVVYRKGRVLKRYAQSDFIKRPTSNYQPCGRFDWIEKSKRPVKKPTFSFKVGNLYFKTIDGKKWVINASSGRVFSYR